MCNEPKFFVCKHCGNFVGMIHYSGAQMICCGDPMTEVVANTTDAAQEKHVPVITITGDNVKVDVGSVAHPMTPEHHIAWIFLETEKGMQRKCLPVDGAPSAEFALTAGDKVIAAYEYCNLHGLWKATV
ncbi:desulfoferrodoxin family protein [Eubacteriaceae bacterium ES2]|nr:desulfoferrodoxin family protein [Eubacteriaceae bacterium ES2]